MTLKEKLKGPYMPFAILIYLLLWLLIGTLLVFLFLVITSKIYDVSLSNISNYYLNKKNTLVGNEINAYYTALGYGNALTYILMAIGVCFYLRDHFYLDFYNLKRNKKFFAIYISITTSIFCVILLCITKWWPYTRSNNQETTELILKYDGFIPMILATMFFAPIVEEAIYRKCIFHYLRSYHPAFSIIASSIPFALIHMLSTSTSFSNWMLEFIPYLISALLLASIYYFGKKNIFASLIAHMANNILAVILIFI